MLSENWNMFFLINCVTILAMLYSAMDIYADNYVLLLTQPSLVNLVHDSDTLRHALTKQTSDCKTVTGFKGEYPLSCF